MTNAAIKRECTLKERPNRVVIHLFLRLLSGSIQFLGDLFRGCRCAQPPATFWQPSWLMSTARGCEHCRASRTWRGRTSTKPSKLPSAVQTQRRQDAETQRMPRQPPACALLHRCVELGDYTV